MTEPNFSDAIDACNLAFDNLCQIRYDKVAEVDGQFTFLTQDVVTQFLEALADTAVMCRKQFIKLLMYQQLMQEDIAEHADDNMGANAFKRTQEE